MKDPTMLPLPPSRLAPPIMAAEMASSGVSVPS
jgi:hypothetical protein